MREEWRFENPDLGTMSSLLNVNEAIPEGGSLNKGEPETKDLEKDEEVKTERRRSSVSSMREENQSLVPPSILEAAPELFNQRMTARLLIAGNYNSQPETVDAFLEKVVKNFGKEFCTGLALVQRQIALILFEVPSDMMSKLAKTFMTISKEEINPLRNTKILALSDSCPERVFLGWNVRHTFTPEETIRDVSEEAVANYISEVYSDILAIGRKLRDDRLEKVGA